VNYVVVDTDAFSHLWQNTQQAAALAPHIQGSVPVLSFTSVAEVYFGAAKANWGDARIRRLDEAVRRYLVVPYEDGMARLWGRLKAQAQSTGHPLGQNDQTNDLWVCATAIYHNAPLLTLNRRHFEGFPGLVLLP
jgi:tRNA(fMet)-specific endonuclease VapC